MTAGLVGIGSLLTLISIFLGLWEPLLDSWPGVLAEYFQLIQMFAVVMGGLLGIVLGILALRDRKGGTAGWAILGIVSGLLTELVLLGWIITSSMETPA